MTDVLEQVDFVLLEDELNSIPCESGYEREAGTPEHEAEWWAAGECGDVIAICDRRRAQCRKESGWWCFGSTVGGCSKFHPYEHIEFRRIT